MGSMNLDTALSIAVTGLRASSTGLRTVASNVANAEVAGYTRKQQNTQSSVPDSSGIGVTLGPETRNVDAALQRDVFARGATVTGLGARESLLQSVEAVHGAPEAGTSLGGLLGRLNDAFNTLAAQPSSAPAQQEAVRAAQALVEKLNQLATAVTGARNRAHREIEDSAKATNAALAEIDTLSIRIRNLKAADQVSPDLEDRRDAALERFTAETGARFMARADGSMLLTGPNGLTWPTEKAKGASEGPLTVAAAELAAGNYHSTLGGQVPGVMLTEPGNPLFPSDVTNTLTGGRIGALIAMRDETLPRMQAELDEFAHKLARRFDQQGLRLFSDGFGNVPEEGGVPVQRNYVGFAGTIRVFAGVVENPALVRDGTHPIPGGVPAGLATQPTGDPQGDIFTPNVAGGPAGFETLAKRILDHTFGVTLKDDGTPHSPAFQNTFLGPEGNLTSTIPSYARLADFAAAVVAAQTAERADATAQREAEGATRDLVRNRLADEAGVNIDAEMSLMVQLQQAYQANARVLQTSRDMYDALFAATNR